jgi:DNA modification methylase
MRVYRLGVRVSVQILIGDARERLKELPAASVHCCVTSPPYFGLRDYGVDGQMGLEATPAEFVEGMVALFREVRRVLRDDGTLWLNLGDSYAGSWGPLGHRVTEGADASWHGSQIKNHPKRGKQTATIREAGLKPKDLIGIPWRVAFALQADGWWLRQDIIWSKPNPMPESVRDRCTKAHEYLFLLSKGPRYHYDADAIAEPLGLASVARLSQNVEDQVGSDRVPGKTNGSMKAVGRRAAGNKSHKGQAAYESGASEHRTKAGLVAFAERERAKVDAGDLIGTRNKRSVWEVATQPFRGAHFATFPPALIEPCILAGCPSGGTVLDPFGGAGTTGLVADKLGRDAVLVELNPAYADLARDRLRSDLCRVDSEAPERTHDAGPLFGSAAA